MPNSGGAESEGGTANGAPNGAAVGGAGGTTGVVPKSGAGC